jgi:PTH2 family peptidyl-tRNA hydrolase
MSDDPLAPFLGLWVRDAPPPAVLTALGDAGGLDLFARWRVGDETHQVAFSAIPDGVPRPMAGQQGLTLRAALEGGALVTEVAAGAGRLLRTRRIPEGEGLRVEQENAGPDGWVQTSERYRRGRVKQVLLYRRDLKMRKGKIAAQCAHASMAVFFRRRVGPPSELRVPLDGPMAVWTAGGFAKVVLSVEGEAELDAALEAARARGLPTALIRDSGRTEFHGVPTVTALGIGPAAVAEIDPITGPAGLVATKLA